MLQPQRVGGVARIAAVEAGDGAEPAELAVVADRQDEPAVGAREDGIGADVVVRVAGARRRNPGREIVHALVGEHAGHRVEQRHVDVLAAAGRLALVERGLDGDHRVETGHDVGEGDAHAMRRAVGLAGQRHDPAHPLDDEVVAGARRVGAVLAEAGDRAGDETRVGRRQARVVEAVFREAADLEVLDHYVGVGDQRLDGGEVLRVGEVGDDRGLAAVARMEIGGVAAAVGIVDEGRSPGTGVVARGTFHLDDLGAEIGERLPGPGTGEDAG